ncbi:putative cell surface antigen [Candida maltosa Xu316]|uniref:Putative cell surface antigen n=1 Tax=Candida maltosa (strain Xu316) TaxID=1245528 RepID=M3IMC4_CANMX|nr:putative cell surface antigen [Candida maltosa Xu316]
MNFFLFFFILLVSAKKDKGTASTINFATFPNIQTTASINGFADPIYDLMPECARYHCLKFGTNLTPCAQWDAPCLCVNSKWMGLVGQCIADNCRGEDVASATFLAKSVCSAVGINTFSIAKSVSKLLTSAAESAKDVTTIIGESGATSPTFTTPATETAASTSRSGSGSSPANFGALQTGSIGTVLIGLFIFLFM